MSFTITYTTSCSGFLVLSNLMKDLEEREIREVKGVTVRTSNRLLILYLRTTL